MLRPLLVVLLGYAPVFTPAHPVFTGTRPAFNPAMQVASMRAAARARHREGCLRECGVEDCGELEAWDGEGCHRRQVRLEYVCPQNAQGSAKE